MIKAKKNEHVCIRKLVRLNSYIVGRHYGQTGPVVPVELADACFRNHWKRGIW